jgi:hypothetical protein
MIATKGTAFTNMLPTMRFGVPLQITLHGPPLAAVWQKHHAGKTCGTSHFGLAASGPRRALGSEFFFFERGKNFGI